MHHDSPLATFMRENLIRRNAGEEEGPPAVPRATLTEELRAWSASYRGVSSSAAQQTAAAAPAAAAAPQASTAAAEVPDEQFTVHLRTLDGSTHAVPNVRASTTIAELKIIAEPLVSVPPVR